jgi:hypothetical protein
MQEGKQLTSSELGQQSSLLESVEKVSSLHRQDSGTPQTLPSRTEKLLDGGTLGISSTFRKNCRQVTVSDRENILGLNPLEPNGYYMYHQP